MHEKWESLMPFYIARTLPAADARALEQHLLTCMSCRRAFDEWRLIANETWAEANERSLNLPPLSEKVRAALIPLPKNVQNGMLGEQTQQVSLRAAEYTRPNMRAYRPPRTSLLPLTAFAAAAALVIALVGVMWIVRSGIEAQIEPLSIVSLSMPLPVTGASSENFAAAPPPMNSPAPSNAADQGILLPSPTSFPTNIMPPQVTPGAAQFAPPSPTRDPSIPGDCRISGGDQSVNVYLRPDRGQQIIAELAPFEEHQVLIENGAGWYQVFLPGNPYNFAGWVSINDVIVEGDCGGLWTPTPTPENLALPIPCYILSDGAPGDLFNGPGDQFELIKRGHPLLNTSVLEKSDTGWIRVQLVFDELPGQMWFVWLDSAQVSLEGECDLVPLVLAEGYLPEIAPGSRSTSTPTPTALSQQASILSGDWSHVTTIMEHQCGGQVGSGTTILLTLFAAADESSITITYASGTSFTLFRAGKGIYSGSAGVVGGPAQINVTLTFTSPWTYTAEEVVIHAETGCIVRMNWSGQAK